jgi:gluconate kinase
MARRSTKGSIEPGVVAVNVLRKVYRAVIRHDRRRDVKEYYLNGPREVHLQ